MVATILICGIGGMSLTFGKITLTEVAVALILGILVNLLVSHKKEDKTKTNTEEKTEETKETVETK